MYKFTDLIVMIHQQPIAHADNPFGAEAIEDTTGLGIWCASLVMARWLASPSMVERMKSKTILELGAGCGIPALSAAQTLAALFRGRAHHTCCAVAL